MCGYHVLLPRKSILKLSRAGVAEQLGALCCDLLGYGFEPPPMLVNACSESTWIERAHLPRGKKVLHQM